MIVFFKQKPAYEMRISDWSSDVCSSDLIYIERWVHYDERWFLPDMAFANLKVILLNGIWKPLVFNINDQGFIPIALPRQKQSAFADTRINNKSALFRSEESASGKSGSESVTHGG